MTGKTYDGEVFERAHMWAATEPNELSWAIWPQVNLLEDWCGEWQPNASMKEP